jgi:hypothetical protein
MPAAPPPPAPVDPAQSSLSFIQAMSDPVLQQRLLAAEQQFRPQYNQLELADINQLMQGSGGQAGLLELQRQAAEQAGAIERSILSQQRAADIGDVEALGGRASAAFLNANPELKAALERAEGLRSSQGMVSPAQQELLSGLTQAGIGQLQAAPGEAELTAAGLDFLGRGGQLTPLQQRAVEQQSRAASVVRGRELDQSSITNEIAARLAQEMNVEQQNVGMGATLLGQGFGMGQQRLGTGFNIGMGTGQMAQNQLAGDRAFAMSLIGARQATASDPFQAILGRPSQAPGMGMAQSQFGANLAQQKVGPNLFDPNAGINLALQQNQNLANYQSSIYGSQAGVAGANAQARGAMIGGLFQGLGALGGGFAAKCWVAREVYGEDNPKWRVFREWLTFCAPKWFYNLYVKHGERFAAWLKGKHVLKGIIRHWMDGRVETMFKLNEREETC